jgi:hypothetical protein
MAASPDAFPFAASVFYSELAFLDIQTAQHQRLQELGLCGQALARLRSAGHPTDTIPITSCVYENQHAAVPGLAFGGVALIGRDHRLTYPLLLGRMHVYTRFADTVLPTGNFSLSEALAVSDMGYDLREQAKKIGLVLCPNLVDLFRVPVPGQPMPDAMPPL